MQTHQIDLSVYPFFADLSAHHLEAVASCASNVRFEAGSYIFREGEEADRFYLIREGKVSLQLSSDRRGPLKILTLEEGDILGWSWLFPPYRWKFSAKTVEPTRAFAFDAESLRAKAEQDPSLGYGLLKRFAHVVETRIETMRLQLVNVYHDK